MGQTVKPSSSPLKQIVHDKGSISGSFVANSATRVEITDMTNSITPSDVASLIEVSMFVGAGVLVSSGQTEAQYGVEITRNGTVVYTDNEMAGGINSNGTTSRNSGALIGVNFIDEPALVGAVEYKMKIFEYFGGGQLQVNSVHDYSVTLKEYLF
jgi:hypothetical protein